MKIKKLINAFTLIELILSVSILTIIAASLFGFFHSGKMIYKRIQDRQNKNSSVNNFFQIIQRDVEHIINWQNCYMVLNSERLYFYTSNEDSMGQISRVDYIIKQSYKNSTYSNNIERIERIYPYKEATYESTLKSTVMVSECIDVSFIASTKTEIQEEKPPEDELPKNELLEEAENLEKPKKPKNSILEFRNWQFNMFPMGLKIKINKLNNEKYELNFWLTKYIYDFPTESLIKLNKEEYKKLQKTKKEL